LGGAFRTPLDGAAREPRAGLSYRGHDPCGADVAAGTYKALDPGRCGVNPVALDLVPRETEPRLREFAELLMRWNQRINLLSRGEIATDLWRRHVLDSAQLFTLAPCQARSWIDLGSGAGFPGLVCATIAAAQG